MINPEQMHQIDQLDTGTLGKGVFSSFLQRSRRKTLSMHDSHDDRVMVHTEYNAKSDTAVYYFLGYRQQILPVRNAVQPVLLEAGTMRYFGAPGGYYSDVALGEAIAESLAEDEGMKIKVVGVSNGGKEAIHQFSKPEIQEKVPYIESWNMDSTPSDFSAIRLPYRAAVIGGELLKSDSRLCQALFEQIMKWGIDEPQLDGDLSQSLLAQAVTYATASTPLEASRSQMVSLLRPMPADGSVARLGLRIGEANYFGAPKDPVVKTTRSHQSIQAALEHPVNMIVERARGRNHAGITDDPRLFAKVLAHGYPSIGGHDSRNTALGV